MYDEDRIHEQQNNNDPSHIKSPARSRCNRGRGNHFKRWSRLNENTTSNIDSSLTAWAIGVCEEHRPSIDYFLKFGSPIEKALVEKVIELAKRGGI